MSRTVQSPEETGRALIGRVEGMLERLEELPEASARAATDAVQALLDLYGEGLTRIVEVIAERDDGRLAEALGDDELVSHLLLLHGLHPVPVEQRVREALEEVLPYLRSHGGGAELLGVEDGVARLALQGSCSGCPSSTMTLRLAIEDAILKAAPDIEEVRAEGLAEPAEPPSGLLQIQTLPAADPRPGAAPSPPRSTWAMAGGMPQLAAGGKLIKEISGQEILFLRPSERIYAYRPSCPQCAGPLDGARLRGGELTCDGCGHTYDVLRAGRSLDAPQQHLEPVPLLVDGDGLVKVALGAPA